MRIHGVVPFVPALLVAWSLAAPPGVLASTPETRATPFDRCVGLDIATRSLSSLTRGSPNCLQIKPATGELGTLGAPQRCVAVAGSGSLSVIEGGSRECVRLDPISVLTGGATGCFGVDRQSGMVRLVTRDSRDCLGVEPKTARLTLSSSPNTCLRFDANIGGFAPIDAGSSQCVRAEAPSGELIFRGPIALDPVRDRWVARLAVDYAKWEVPKAGVGTLIFIGPGSEVDAILRRQDAKGVSIDLSLMRERFGVWEAGYFQGEATSRATEPVDGAQVGFVYDRPSPSGSLGLNTGRNGGVFKLDSDVKFYYFGYAPPVALHRSESPDGMLDLRPEVTFAHVRTDYDGWSQSIRIPGIYSERRQRVEENRFGIGLRGHASRSFADNIVGRFVLNLDLIYRDADLNSRQSNVCAATGCAPAATFDANITDADSGFTWQAGLRAGIDYSLDRDSRLGLDFGYRYLADTAAVQNPTRTIDFDPPPRLRAASVNFWQIGISYRLTF